MQSLQDTHEHQSIELHFFADDGRTPNNPVLPMVLLRNTVPTDAPDTATWLEEKFQANNWGSTWRWTVYPYHHFHSTNHEVLGVSLGHATIKLGGEKGKEFQVSLGDVMILPAGIGHMCMSSSDDFQVVGGYPEGEEPDLIRSGEGDIQEARNRIAKVKLPELDPIGGKTGAISSHWRV